MNAPTRVVGVHYDLGDAAPTVVVKSAGAAAEALLRRALSNDHQQVVRDPELVRELYRVPVNGTVGSALFPVMASLLVHVLERDRSEEGTRR